MRSESPRLLCFVITGPENHYKKVHTDTSQGYPSASIFSSVQAIHVKRTWGSHCDKLIFMSSQEDIALGAVNLNVSEGRENLWGKTKRAFQYCHRHHHHQFDWFVKADDDTFMVIENLRHFLQDYSPDDPVHFGHNFKMFDGYFSGGAGYVLSREAVRRFTEVGLRSSALCHDGDDGEEDVKMGECMRNLNVTHGDSRDEKARKRFFPFTPLDHIIPSTDF